MRSLRALSDRFTEAAPVSALWRLHAPVTIVVAAPPDECVRTLATASRPSQKRLHLRDVFNEGRRYYVRPREGGFTLTSDNRMLWGNSRTRAPRAAIIDGQLSSSAGDTPFTYVRLRARWRIPYVLGGLLIPLFFASLVVYMPWPAPVAAVIATLLFLFSLAAHRLSAALQATDMIYFVRKAMDDLPPAVIPELATGAPQNVVTPNFDNEFREAWARYHQG